MASVWPTSADGAHLLWWNSVAVVNPMFTILHASSTIFFACKIRLSIIRDKNRKLAQGKRYLLLADPFDRSNSFHRNVSTDNISTEQSDHPDTDRVTKAFVRHLRECLHCVKSSLLEFLDVAGCNSCRLQSVPHMLDAAGSAIRSARAQCLRLENTRNQCLTQHGHAQRNEKGVWLRQPPMR